MIEGFNEAGFQGAALQTHLPDTHAMSTPHFLVEYGVRVDDLAMVFHFYSPEDAPAWPDHARWRTRLERAIESTFDMSAVSADYVPEMDSYCVIVRGMGARPDPLAFAKIFLDRVIEGSS